MTVSQKLRMRLAFAAGALILAALGLRWLARGPLAGGVADGLLIGASALAGLPIALRAWQALRVRAFSIDLLVTIAVAGALSIGEYLESAAVSFLFLFGAWLEARTLERTRSSLRGLISLAPSTATVLRHGKRVVVDADEVAAGEQLVVVSGERIAADGVVAAGEAEVSEASITGEPVPRARRVGDSVFASSIVESGFITVTARRVGADTTYAHIIELVEEAQESKTRRQRFLDRFAQYYTPAVMVVGVLAFGVTHDLAFALTFLVIACPGALVLSVPVAAVAGLGNIAGHGVLVKDVATLEDLARASVLVVDKTGTLTRGRPGVTAVRSLGEMTRDELLRWAGSAELASEHHLARAIVGAARDRGVEMPDPDAARVIAGRGVVAEVTANGAGSRTVAVGSVDLLAEVGVPVSELARTEGVELARSGATPVFVSIGDECVGVIGVADEVRDEAGDALARLRRQGFRRVIMLTGDRQAVGERVGRRLAVDEVRGGLLPADKAAAVRALKQSGAAVVMVGDGVNDAPALAVADVGVAMGGSGTDLSVESADVVLLTDRLDQLAYAHQVSRSTVRIMEQNMAIALATVALLIAGVLTSFVHLAGGMFVHEASVLLVVVNALRLTSSRAGRVGLRTRREPEVENAVREQVA